MRIVNFSTVMDQFRDPWTIFLSGVHTVPVHPLEEGLLHDVLRGRVPINTVRERSENEVSEVRERSENEVSEVRERSENEVSEVRVKRMK